MTQMNSPADFTSVAAKLDALDAAMLETIKSSAARNRSLMILSVVTFIFLCGYLGYAYMRFGGEVTPQLVAANAQAGFEQYLPQAKEQLEQNLKANAPMIVGAAFTKVQAMPEQFADGLNKEASDHMDAAMPEVENSLYASLKDAVINAGKASNGNDEDRFKLMLVALNNVYGTETLKFVNEVHSTYANQAVSFIDYMDKLAMNQNLDRRQKLHREMFRTIFTLVQQHAKESGSVDPLKTTLLQPVQ